MIKLHFLKTEFNSKHFIFHSDLCLNDLSFKAIDLISSFPADVDDLCDCIQKISKWICNEISLELDLNQENINDCILETTDEDESSSDSD